MRYLFGLALVLLASAAHAEAIYVSGSECPADPLADPYTRQYYVTPSIACVFDPTSNNLQGTDAEALTYLEGGPAIWGEDWDGLGQNPTGLTIVADAGNDDGTFTIEAALAAMYDQFALAIKDGSMPFWAIFLLPAGTTSGDWGLSTLRRLAVTHGALRPRCRDATTTPAATPAAPAPDSRAGESGAAGCRAGCGGLVPPSLTTPLPARG